MTAPVRPLHPFEEQATYLLRSGFVPPALPCVMLSIRRLPRGHVTARPLAPMREVPVFDISTAKGADLDSIGEMFDVRRVVAGLARAFVEPAPRQLAICSHGNPDPSGIVELQPLDHGAFDADATEVQ